MLEVKILEIRLEIKYFAKVREVTKKEHETVNIPKKSNLRELMELLSEKYPNTMRSYMFDEVGRPIDYLSYFINGRNTHSLQGFSSEIKEGDVLIIAPSILGG